MRMCVYVGVGVFMSDFITFIVRIAETSRTHRTSDATNTNK